MNRPTFLLDQDFPFMLTDRNFWPGVVLVPLREQHIDLTSGHDDWEVLQKLRARGGCDGLVTLDAGMLNLAKEVVVLQQTRLKLIVIEDTDNDPFVATGVLMAYMPQILKRFDSRRAQIWRIAPGPRLPERPWRRLRMIAQHQNTTAGELLRANRLSNTQLSSL